MFYEDSKCKISNTLMFQKYVDIIKKSKFSVLFINK